SPPVAVVNRAFVNRYVTDERALGQQISLTDEPRWFTIIGVAEQSRQAGLDAEARPEVDLAYSQSHWQFLTSTMSMVVRTQTDPVAISRTVRQAIYSADPDQAVYGVRSMASVISESQADRRFVMWLLGLFALLALTLAAMGLFGQISYAVTRRAHEIGVRIAIGARPRDVFGLIVTEGAKQVIVGLALGLAGSFGLMRVLSGSLYGVRPADPVTIGVAAIVLAAVALLACYLPARRAMRADPISALHCQ
ncbi:MAG: FtsX-like permease family protein, partial [Blastocatellia bacterium]